MTVSPVTSVDQIQEDKVFSAVEAEMKSCPREVMLVITAMVVALLFSHVNELGVTEIVGFSVGKP